MNRKKNIYRSATVFYPSLTQVKHLSIFHIQHCDLFLHDFAVIHFSSHSKYMQRKRMSFHFFEFCKNDDSRLHKCLSEILKCSLWLQMKSCSGLCYKTLLSSGLKGNSAFMGHDFVWLKLNGYQKIYIACLFASAVFFFFFKVTTFCTLS